MTMVRRGLWASRCGLSKGLWATRCGLSRALGAGCGQPSEAKVVRIPSTSPGSHASPRRTPRTSAPHKSLYTLNFSSCCHILIDTFRAARERAGAADRGEDARGQAGAGVEQAGQAVGGARLSPRACP